MDNFNVAEVHKAMRERLAQGVSYAVIETEWLQAGYSKEQIKLVYNETLALPRHATDQFVAQTAPGIHPPKEKNDIKKVFLYTTLGVGSLVILLSVIALSVNTGVIVDQAIKKIEAFIPEYLAENNESLLNFCENEHVVSELDVIERYTDTLFCKTNNDSVLIQYVHQEQQMLCMNTEFALVPGDKSIPLQISCLELPTKLEEMELDHDSSGEMVPTEVTTSELQTPNASTLDSINVPVESGQIGVLAGDVTPEIPPAAQVATPLEVSDGGEKSLRIISPQGGDQFCVEDGIKIVWESTLENVDYFGLGLNKPNSGLPIGQQLSYRDATSRLQRYEYNWNFKDRSGALIQPGHLYSVSIAAFASDGSRVDRVFSDGRFSAIECY